MRVPPQTSQSADVSPAATYDGPTLTMLVVASMVGVGVFTTSGFTLGAVGSPLLVMVCWALAGMIAMCGAVAYGQLAQLMPQSGGEYLYLSRHVHPLAGFLAGKPRLNPHLRGLATCLLYPPSWGRPLIKRGLLRRIPLRWIPPCSNPCQATHK